MASRLHNDVGCSYRPNNFGERFHWYSSTGWVMWNSQTSGPALGHHLRHLRRQPGRPRDAPDWGTLWRFAARHGVTYLGSGAAFYAGCAKAGVDLAQCGDLSRIRALGTTGSPLSPEVQQWGTDQFKRIAEIKSGNPPPGRPKAGWAPGRRSRRSRAAWGRNLVDEHLRRHRLCRRFHRRHARAAAAARRDAVPHAGRGGRGLERGGRARRRPGRRAGLHPAHPVHAAVFLERPRQRRYLASYFEMYPPGHGRKPGGGDLDASAGSVWRHGDWLRVGDERGQGEWCVIFGRSDATINRQGLRMGTSEIYSAVEALPEVLDSMVVDLEYLGRESYMPLFVVLRPGVALDDDLKQRINDAIRQALSPRFVPNAIFQVPEIPRTLSGKKQELPIKKLLLGQPIDKVVNREAMANPGSLAWYVDFARRRQDGQVA
jgi:acetoacetyl-CoA synthetase